MKKILIISLVYISAVTGFCAADELVLETGKILSGRVTDLTEDTVSIVVNGNAIEINRDEVEAVFSGENHPFFHPWVPRGENGRYLRAER